MDGAPALYTPGEMCVTKDSPKSLSIQYNGMYGIEFLVVDLEANPVCHEFTTRVSSSKKVTMEAYVLEIVDKIPAVANELGKREQYAKFTKPLMEFYYQHKM